MISGKSISNINQVVAGDLTYVYLGTHLYYVFSLMDLYSNRIVGMSVSERMRAKDALEAYFQWKSLRNGHRIKGCVHHTDGGSQYFSSTYLSELKSMKFKLAEQKHVWRMDMPNNGTPAKESFIPTIKYQNVKNLTEEIKQITYFYNNERKQEQLGWQTPVQYETYIGTLLEKQKPVKRLYNFEDPKDRGFGGIVGQKLLSKEGTKKVLVPPKFITFLSKIIPWQVAPQQSLPPLDLAQLS
ncbi:MAG: DDE-type integrase/transposase/recombinase [Saprospiraceae bacterium]|nr:DDE-type integrase/transposase/recombinase [Saprospiraceae bacterium]